MEGVMSKLLTRSGADKHTSWYHRDYEKSWQKKIVSEVTTNSFFLYWGWVDAFYNPSWAFKRRIRHETVQLLPLFTAGNTYSSYPYTHGKGGQGSHSTWRIDFICIIFTATLIKGKCRTVSNSQKPFWAFFLIKWYFPLLCIAKCFFCRAVKAGIERTIQLFSSWYLFKTNQMAWHIAATALLLVTNSGCIFPVSSLLVNYLHLM